MPIHLVFQITDVYKLKYFYGYCTGQSRKDVKLWPPVAATQYSRPSARQGYLFLAVAAKDCGDALMTNFNKAAVRGWFVSQSW